MTKVLFDFTDASAVRSWSAIDDSVMGGVSRSRREHDPAGRAVFKGTVSLERNGGFASVRSSSADRGQAGATSCLIEVRGEPKQFKRSLLTDDGTDSVNYQATFNASPRPCSTFTVRPFLCVKDRGCKASRMAAQHPVHLHAMRHAGNAAAIPVGRELGSGL